MTSVAQKPIIHGRDHGCGGADPIPGICELQGLIVGSYEEQILAEPSLVGYWPLDDPAGTTAHDESATGVDLTSSGTPTFEQPGPFADVPEATSCKFDAASGFSASSDQLVDATSWGVGHPPWFFDGTTAYTFEALVYATAVPGTFENGIVGVAGYPAGSTHGIYLTHLPSGHVRVWRAGLSWDTADALNASTWVHVAMTYDGSTLKVYFDGAVEISTATATSHSSAGFLRVGSIRVDGSGDWVGNFQGRLAQVAIFDEALDAATIAAHAHGFSSGGSSTIGPPSGPAGGVLDGTYPNPGLAASVAGPGLAESADVLAVNVDGSTLEIASDVVRVKADGIGSSELAATGVTPGTYGDTTHVPQVTIDADGRLTAAADVAVSGGGAAVATDPIWDAKGDLAVASGADAADNLPVGSNGQVLQADSTQTLGVKWATPAAGGGMTKLFDSVLSVDGGTTLDTGAGGIAGGYLNLEIFILARLSGASAINTILMQLNNDTGANYNWEEVFNNAATTAAATGLFGTTGWEAAAVGGAAAANYFGAIHITIPNYDSTASFKSALWREYVDSGGGTSAMTVHNRGGIWRSTAAISRFALNTASVRVFKAGTRMTIYGCG